MIRFNLSSSALTFLGLLTPLGLTVAYPLNAEAGAGHNHGGGSEEELESGEFRSMPVITLEGHGGYENNLEGKPAHYAIDGMFGAVMEWGLPNQGSFAIEAAIGPALVWGEAEHFYGRVELEEEEGEEAHGDEDHGDEDHGDEEHGDELAEPREDKHDSFARGALLGPGAFTLMILCPRAFDTMLLFSLL